MDATEKVREEQIHDKKEPQNFEDEANIVDDDIESSTFREFEMALENEIDECKSMIGETIDDKMGLLGRYLPVHSNERVLKANKYKST